MCHGTSTSMYAPRALTLSYPMYFSPLWPQLCQVLAPAINMDVKLPHTLCSTNRLLASLRAHTGLDALVPI